MAPASDNVWIGDLPAGMDKGSLATIFEAYGTVVECRVMPGKDEAAKSCAMVRFATVEMATWIVDSLNGNIPEGLQEPIQCRYANAPKGKGGGDGKGAAGGSWGPYGGGGGTAKGGGGKAGFQAPPPSDNVWIGDLPVGTEQESLGQIFQAYGQIVSSKMLPGRDPAAKPCAMLRFASVDMAKWVVENLNGNIPEGLEGPIICRFANAGGQQGGGKGSPAPGGWQQPATEGAWGGQQQQPWDSGKGGGNGGKGGKGKGGAPGSFAALYEAVKGAGVLGGGKAPQENQIFLKNLPTDTTDFDLYKLCSPFGAIPPNGVKAMLNPDGSCKGIGFVDFADSAAASTAVISLDGHTTPDGSVINVNTKKPSLAGKGKGKGKE